MGSESGRKEPETTWTCLKILQSLCQATQIFLFLPMMKIRYLNLSEKLERHHLSPLEWQVLQQLLHMDYIDWRAGEILKCLSTWSTCVWQPKALLWEQWLLVWAIPCIKNSGENLNLRRGNAVLVLLVVFALVRQLILKLYVYAENKLGQTRKKNLIIKHSITTGMSRTRTYPEVLSICPIPIIILFCCQALHKNIIKFLFSSVPLTYLLIWRWSVMYT